MSEQNPYSYLEIDVRELRGEIGRLRERVASLEGGVQRVEKNQSANAATLQSIDQRLAHWKGGLGTVLAVGGFIGAIATAVIGAIVKHWMEIRS